MSKQIEQYVVGILFYTKDIIKIKFVTSVNNHPKIAKWEDDKEAMVFSKQYATDLAFGLCVNGHIAIPMLKADYLTLGNPTSEGDEYI